MTHTLHRFGTREDFRDDFIVTAMPARGFNDGDCIPKQRAFLRAALAHSPINIGNSVKGAAHRASKDLRPTVHWRREDGADPEQVILEVGRIDHHLVRQPLVLRQLTDQRHYFTRIRGDGRIDSQFRILLQAATLFSNLTTKIIYEAP